MEAAPAFGILLKTKRNNYTSGRVWTLIFSHEITVLALGNPAQMRLYVFFNP